MSEEKNQNEIEEVTNEDEHKDVEHYCYLCRRPESAAGKMLELPNNIFICTDCMQRTLNSMGNGQFGFIDARNMDLDSMDISKMMNDMQSMQPKAEVKKKKKDKKDKKKDTKQIIPKVYNDHSIEMKGKKETIEGFIYFNQADEAYLKFEPVFYLRSYFKNFNIKIKGEKLEELENFLKPLQSDAYDVARMNVQRAYHFKIMKNENFLIV